DHDPKHIQSPEQGGDHVVISVLKAESQANQSSENKWRGNPHGPYPTRKARTSLFKTTADRRSTTLSSDALVELLCCSCGNADYTALEYLRVPCTSPSFPALTPLGLTPR